MEIPLTRIRKAPKQIRRFRHIVAVLARYGLADWAYRLPLGFVRELLARRIGRESLEESTEKRLLRAMGELGPTFIKFGQLLSVRPDIAGPSLAEELNQLQDHAPADPWETVRESLERELRGPIGDLFMELDPVPVASASIAQVHRGVLRSGEEIAVKILHSGVERVVETDLDILMDLAELLERYIPESRAYRPRDLLQEARKILYRELDLRRELHNMELFYRNFLGDPRVKIPRPLAELSTEQVLTMEYIHGTKVTDLQVLRALGVDPREVALVGAGVFLDMIFDHGLFHGDPHPGNWVVTPAGEIGLLDYGMVGRLGDELLHDLEEFLVGLAQRDARKITHTFIRMGATPPDLERGIFHADLNEFLGYYTEVPIGEADVATAVREILRVIRRHRIVLPPDLALLAKVIITLDGTGKTLYPDFRLMDLLLPYREKIVRRRLSPARQVRKFQRIAEDVDRLVQTAPASLYEVLRQVEGGNLTVQMRVKDLEEAGRQVGKSANRLAFGLLTAAIVLSSSLLIVVNVPPLFLGYSALGLAGYLISGFFGARLLWAIYRSGRLN